MQIGWIDFSKEDRDRVLSVVQLLREPGALDELGLGTIRDAFADYFFPGISTIQTRAKYFLLVPYILREAGNWEPGRGYGYDLDKVTDKIDERERACRDQLMKGNTDGVIGRDLYPDGWVIRKPSQIYWSGIKRWGIFTGPDMSIQDYLRISLDTARQNSQKIQGRQEKKAGAESVDDQDPSDFYYNNYWDIGLPEPEDHFTDLSIDLTTEEADFLHDRIIQTQPGSLLAYLVNPDNRMNLSDYGNFAAMTEAVIAQGKISQEMKGRIQLANDFNNFAHLIKARYNVILYNNTYKKSEDEWDKGIQNPSKYLHVDLDSIYDIFELRKNYNLVNFLNYSKKALQENNINALDELIKKREKDIKKDRAKLLKGVNYSTFVWVGGEWFDYRYSSARQILQDIYAGERVQNV